MRECALFHTNYMMRIHLLIVVTILGSDFSYLSLINARNSYGVTQEVHAFVSKVDRKINESRGWECRCYNGTFVEGSFDKFETECRCLGPELKEVPIHLDENMHRITITDSNIKLLERDSFQPYRFTLQEVILGNLPEFESIEAGTFRDIPNLRTLYISHCPQIKFLCGLFNGFSAKMFLSLRIVQTGLLEIPAGLSVLSDISSENIMHMVDLEGNQIERVASNALRIRADQVILNRNEIISLGNFAFNGSEIGKLSLRGNTNLKSIEKNAFKGIHSLRHLDLSETAIKEMPTAGLEEIETIKIEDTPTMKTIPSLYDLSKLQVAYLTHSFHCCAFKYPEQHDPIKHAQHEERLNQMCRNHLMGLMMDKKSRERRQSWGNSPIIPEELGYESMPGKPGPPNDFTPNLEHLKGHPNKKDHSHLSPLTGTHIGHEAGTQMYPPEVLGTFHNSAAEFSEQKQVSIFCGNLTRRSSLIECYPEPNALNPCEDIMGSYYLRVSVWFVLLLAVCGNLGVVVVLLFGDGEITVARFFMCNLAFADLCMGLYLLLIAAMDLHSVGSYFNFAFDWQYGFGCQIAGFLTVFASQLSIFTLTMITVERWFAITYAIYLTRRITRNLAVKVMLLGWLYAILMATLPLVGVSNYSSTSICLPMEVNEILDITYLILIIVANGLAFALIVFCYAQIYFSLAYESRHIVNKGEMTIAKKMALLVFTDFACWAPIAFFALSAIAGYPLIDVTKSKILLVFFYPLNSCANPYLYAIMTAQYRKDFLVLFSKFGLNKGKKDSLTNTMPTNTTPMPLLLTHFKDIKLNFRQNGHLDDFFD